MIRLLRGDYVQIAADQNGVEIREPMTGQTMNLTDDGWRELVFLLKIVGEANSDRPA